MGVATRAIETAGTIDAQRQLVLDEPLPIDGPTRVRVIILIPETSLPKVDVNTSSIPQGGVHAKTCSAESDVYPFG